MFRPKLPMSLADLLLGEVDEPYPMSDEDFAPVRALVTDQIRAIVSELAPEFVARTEQAPPHISIHEPYGPCIAEDVMGIPGAFLCKECRGVVGQSITVMGRFFHLNTGKEVA